MGADPTGSHLDRLSSQMGADRTWRRSDRLARRSGSPLPEPLPETKRARGRAITTDPARLARLATFVCSPEVGYILRSRSGEYSTFRRWGIFYVSEVGNILRFGGGEYFALLRMSRNSNNDENHSYCKRFSIAIAARPPC
jgi:hypothetical protein